MKKSKLMSLILSCIVSFVGTSASHADYIPRVIEILLNKVGADGSKMPISAKQIFLTGSGMTEVFGFSAEPTTSTRNSNTSDQGVASFKFPDMRSGTFEIWERYGFWVSEALCAKVNGPYYCYNLAAAGIDSDYSEPVERPIKVDSQFFYAKDENGNPMGVSEQNALPLSCECTLLGRDTSANPLVENWEIDCTSK